MRKVMLSELEDILAEYYDEPPDDMDCIFVEIDEDSVLVAEDPEIQIPDYDIALREGEMFAKYEDGEFYPDWGLTVLYPLGKSPKDYLYYEQDGVTATLHNYFASLNKGLMDTECIICD